MHEANAIVTLGRAMRDRRSSVACPRESASRSSPTPSTWSSFTPQASHDVPRPLGLGLDDDPVVGYISTFAVFEGIETLLEVTAERGGADGGCAA